VFLGRVRGHIVATAKDPSMKGQRLIIVEPLKVDYEDPAAAANKVQADKTSGGKFEVTGRAIIAIDTLGAGEGQLVLVSQGSSARMAEGMNKVPVDAIVLGIVDEAHVMGRKIPLD